MSKFSMRVTRHNEEKQLLGSHCRPSCLTIKAGASGLSLTARARPLPLPDESLPASTDRKQLMASRVREARHLYLATTEHHQSNSIQFVSATCSNEIPAAYQKLSREQAATCSTNCLTGSGISLKQHFPPRLVCTIATHTGR